MMGVPHSKYDTCALKELDVECVICEGQKLFRGMSQPKAIRRTVHFVCSRQALNIDIIMFLYNVFLVKEG